MTDDTANLQPPAPPPSEPHPTLKTLEPLVGIWEVKGSDSDTDDAVSGRIEFEWMEGGFFLIQKVELAHSGSPGKGLEIIGYDEAAGVCTSNYFDSSGNRFTYAWEVAGDTLRIWFGGKGSPAGFTGTFSDGGKTLTGQWEWPGGGYHATSTKIG